MPRFLGWEIRRSKGAPFIDRQHAQDCEYCVRLLLQACQAADALYLRLRNQNKLTAGDEVVGDQIVEALHLAQRLGL